MQENNERRDNPALAISLLVLGSAAGYLAGILTAKKTGQELRQEINNEAQKTMRMAQESCSRLCGQAEEKVSKFKQEAMKRYEEMKIATQGEKFNLAKQINQIFHRSKNEAQEVQNR